MVAGTSGVSSSSSSSSGAGSALIVCVLVGSAIVCNAAAVAGVSDGVNGARCDYFSTSPDSSGCFSNDATAVTVPPMPVPMLLAISVPTR